MPGILPRSQNRTHGNRVCNYRALCLTLICLLVITLIAVGLGLGIPALLKMKTRPDVPLGEAIEKIKGNVDTSRDPCEDFHQYACGNYYKNEPNPQDRILMDVPAEIEIKMNLQLQKLMSAPKDPKEFHVYHKIKDFYASCMDTDRIEHLEVEPLKILINKLGGWPVVVGPSWKPIAKTFEDLHRLIYENGIIPKYLLQVNVIPDLINTNKSILFLFQPMNLGLYKKEYSAEYNPNLHVYLNTMIKLAEFFGASSELAETEMKELLLFEIELANLTWYSNYKSEQLPIYELQSQEPEILWVKFVNSMLPYMVSEKQQILVRSTDYLRKFSSLISKIPIRTLTNYFVYRLVLSNVLYMNAESLKIREEFEEIVSGTKPSDRSTKCVGDVKHFLGSGLSLMYVRNFVGENTKTSVTKMMEHLKTQFLRRLESTTWMDDETKKKAKEKVEVTKHFISYPKSYFDNEQIEDLYKDLVIDNGTYFKNVIDADMWTYNNKMFSLHQPFSTSEWSILTKVLELVSTYFVLENSIRINFAFLQPMYYFDQGLDAVNYGALGSIIAHEFFHAVDKIGGNYNKEGQKLSWWSTKTTDDFIEASSCFVEKYNSYVDPVTNKSVDGHSTLAENLADYVGVKLSYVAYDKLLESEMKTRPLPKDFPWTYQQLFWLSYANMYCQKLLPDKQLVSHDEKYSPNIFRINGPLTALPEFLKDFKCNERSKMGDRRGFCTL